MNNVWRFAHASPGTPGAQLVNTVGTQLPKGRTVGPTTVTGLPTGNLPRPLGGTFPGDIQGVPGMPTGRAQGNNPPISTSENPPELPKGPTVLGYSQESAYRGGQYFANDKLIAYDRHAFLKVGYENSGRKSGQTDPPMDGPARPSLAVINRAINPQIGSDATRNQDDLSRDFARNSTGMYVGEQGSGWSPIYGGVPGLYQPYGSYAGYTSGEVKGIQSPVAQGSPMDGPRKVWSGPPHGLHTQTYPDYSQTLGYYLATPGMQPPRMDRPSNSPISGQSYSQLVLPQGATATVTNSQSMLQGRNRIRLSGWKGM